MSQELKSISEKGNAETKRKTLHQVRCALSQATMDSPGNTISSFHKFECLRPRASKR